MSQNNMDKFLKEVLSYIKFPFAKEEIKSELEGHISDKTDYYMGKGYSKVEAEKLAVNDMGDAKMIGIGLNKQHKPLLGWMLKITNAFVGIVLFLSAFFAIIFILPSTIISFFISGPISDIPKENIEYRIDLEEQVRIDNRVINFTNLVYEKNGNMNILYNEREVVLFGRGGWGFGTIGEIYDDQGNEYSIHSGRSTGGINNKSIMTIENFPEEEVEQLIIDYDRYNRQYRVEIPLKTGETNE